LQCHTRPRRELDDIHVFHEFLHGHGFDFDFDFDLDFGCPHGGDGLGKQRRDLGRGDDR